jgi:phage terminase large subunit-like protein
VPTLGWQVIDWMSSTLAAPDRAWFEPFVPTREQAQFLLSFYAVVPKTGRRRYRRGVLSRPKGWGKSPLLAAIACAEALAPVVPDGWDADGQPVGRPWCDLRTPWVQLAAVSEDQTRNAWAPLLEMLREGPAVDLHPGLEPLDSFVNLPKGRMEFVTSAATSREGNRPVFAVLDQTEEWRPSNGGVRLAATVRRNLGKTGGASIESPNAFIPGGGSVAEDSAEYARRIRDGRARDDGLLYDHREAPATTELHDRDSLIAGLKVAYGDSDWVDLDRIVAEVWDPATDPQDARRFYLNQVTHATDSWLSQPEWAGCADATKVLADRDLVVLGFDGSKSRKRGVADATALVVVRVIDGHTELVRAWEQPDGPLGEDWEVPAVEVEAEVAQVHKRFRVVGFYADPARWESYIASWEAKYSGRYKIKASARHPIEWWINAGRATTVAKAIEAFHTAVLERRMSHDGGSIMTRHILNARREPRTQGLWIRKEHPDSSRKIDAAWAAVLAWAARQDALAAGYGRPPPRIARKLR